MSNFYDARSYAECAYSESPFIIDMLNVALFYCYAEGHCA